MKPLVAILALAALALWANLPPPDQPRGRRADRVVVLKAARRLELWRGNERLAQYPVSLGGSPLGPKRVEGDERTPEGRYVIDWRQRSTRTYKALHISYPSEVDRVRARRMGRSPGGMVEVHGVPPALAWVGRVHLLWDWTDGCVAVTNREMDQLWASVPDGVPIDILP